MTHKPTTTVGAPVLAATPALAVTSDGDKTAHPSLTESNFISCNKVMFIVSDSYAFDAIYKQAAEAAKGPDDVIFTDESILYNVRMQASSLAIDSVDIAGRLATHIMSTIEKMYDKYNSDEIVIVFPYIKNYWLVPFTAMSIVDRLMSTDWGHKLVEDEEIAFYGLDVPAKMLVPFATNMQPYEISLRLTAQDLAADKAAEAMCAKLGTPVSAFEERMSKAAIPPAEKPETKTAVQGAGGAFNWRDNGEYSHLDY